MLQDQLKNSEKCKKKKKNSRATISKKENPPPKKQKAQCNLGKRASTLLPNHMNSTHVTLASSAVTYYITVGWRLPATWLQ